MTLRGDGKSSVMENRPAGVMPVVASVALFALCHALAVALCFVLIRRHLDGVASAAVSLVHVAALAGSVLLALKVMDRTRPELAIALGAFGGYLLPLPGLALGPWMLVASLPLAVAGTLLSLRAAFTHSPLAAVLLAAGGLLSGLILFPSLNGLHYAHLFAREFTVLGWQAGDPVFHAAIAALFSQYSIPTVGLDGTPLLFYHVGSHALVAALATTAGETALLTYPAAQQIFFIPALLLGTALMAASFSSFRRDAAWLAPLGTVLSWHLYEWFGAYNSFWLSESYAVSLGLAAFGFPMLFMGPTQGYRALLGWMAAALALAALSIAAKFTVAFAWVLAAGAGLLRTRPETGMPRLTLALAGLALALYGLLLAGLFWQLSAVNANGFFAYAQTYPRLYQVSLGAAVIGIAAASWLRMSGLAAPSPLVMLGFAVLLHVPDIYLNDGAGGAHYWFHPADHVAAAVAVAALVAVADALRRRWRLGPALLATTLAMATGYVAYNAQGFVPQVNAFANTLVALDRLAPLDRQPDIEPAQGVRSHELARQLLAPDRAEPWSARSFASFVESLRTIAGKSWSGTDGRLADFVASTPLARAARQARETAADAGGDRPGAFIEPGSAWRWAPARDCAARNYAFQALSGMALIAGIPNPDDACPAGTGYGLGSYDATALNRAMDDTALCVAATGRRLRPVIRLSPGGDATVVDCGP